MLTYTDISSNSLGAEAGVIMRDALEDNSSLTSLDVRVNKIAPDGAYIYIYIYIYTYIYIYLHAYVYI
jgi:hypothetical protein